MKAALGNTTCPPSGLRITVGPAFGPLLRPNLVADRLEAAFAQVLDSRLYPPSGFVPNVNSIPLESVAFSNVVRSKVLMHFHVPLAFPTGLALFPFLSVSAAAQVDTLLCRPSVRSPVVVASPKQRYDAGQKAEPPLTDHDNGFAWPDTPLGIIKNENGYQFFASDGGTHDRQMWQGRWVGNNKYGSVVITSGTLDNPLGSGDPQDVSVSPNPDPAVNPNYPSYAYMGGGPVYQVPVGMTGAGNLLATYHAELPDDPLYAALGLAVSLDNGLHWTDLGEIIRLNPAYAVGLDGFEIGDGPLVLSPDGKYFYLYFPDWISNGTLHTTTLTGISTTTNVSVARALAASVLDAAFESAGPHNVPPYLSRCLAALG